jgi:hypothetical protein
MYENHFPTINRTAEAAIAPYRIVTTGSTELVDVQADAVADALCGVNGSVAVTAGSRYDLNVSGIVPVEYGGNVVRGNKLTTDASGRAVVIAAATDRVIGIAWESGDLGTIGSVLLRQS